MTMQCVASLGLGFGGERAKLVRGWCDSGALRGRPASPTVLLSWLLHGRETRRSL